MAPMNNPAVPLLTDLYQLNMVQAYLEHGETETAVFEFLVRKLPRQRGFLTAAGPAQALDFLEGLRFSGEELAIRGVPGLPLRTQPAVL
jgi:nicotinate phosphoribosyltransferase